MITELTTEQKQKIVDIKVKYLGILTSGELYHKFSEEKLRKAYEGICKIYNMKVPEIRILPSPKKINELVSESAFSGYLDSADLGLVAYYEYLKEVLGLMNEESRKKYYLLKEIVENVFMSKVHNDILYVSRYPLYIKTEDNRLHCSDGPAIEFEDGFKMHFINGRFVKESIIDNTTNIDDASKLFFNTSNDDEKALIAAIVRSKFGNKGLLDMLQAEVVASKEIKHSDSYTEVIELIHTKQKYGFLIDSGGNTAYLPYAWLKYTCPSTSVEYYIDTYGDYDIEEAIKAHRPGFVPENIEYLWPEFAT